MLVEDYPRLVEQELGSVCSEFQLTIHELSPEDIALRGPAFLLLLSCDRDGLTVFYVPLRGGSVSLVDIGTYLITKRKWVRIDPWVTGDNLAAKVRQDLASWALNLRSIATDILRGETNWLAEISSRPLPAGSRMEELIYTIVPRSAS